MWHAPKQLTLSVEDRQSVCQAATDVIKITIVVMNLKTVNLVPVNVNLQMSFAVAVYNFIVVVENVWIVRRCVITNRIVQMHLMSWVAYCPQVSCFFLGWPFIITIICNPLLLCHLGRPLIHILETV